MVAKWEMEKARDGGVKIHELLRDGWKPFAVTECKTANFDGGVTIYFRKQVIENKRES